MGTFRIGVNISTGGVPITTDSYDVVKAEDADAFMDPQVLAQRYAQYNDTRAVQGVLDFRGVEFIGSYADNSPVFTVRVPAFDEGGVPYVLVFNGATRAESYALFDDYLDIDGDAAGQAEAERLLRLLLKALARLSPMDPLAGNPGSLQGSMVRDALDMSSGDSVAEGGTNTTGDPWVIGGTFTTASSGRYSSKRYDLRLQRSFPHV